MVGVSYHELNAGTKRTERHTAGERKQFLVVCVVGLAFLANSLINAGIFETVNIKDDGIFPGGVFVHKFIEHQDSASTGGFWRETRADLLIEKEGDDSMFDDDLYAVYVDLTHKYGGVGRFFSGIMVDESKAPMKQKLLEANVNRKDKIPYEIGDLPSVRAGVVKFPWTDGFVSALLHNYKVTPALYEWSKKNLPEGQKFIVSVSCNREKQMCTHYIPMIETEKFLMGHIATENYEGFEEDQVNLEQIYKGIKISLRNMFSFVGFGSKK